MAESLPPIRSRRKIRSYRIRIPIISREIIFRAPTLHFTIPSFLYSLSDCVMYILGPFLIGLALCILTGLAYTFYTIILPMISPEGYFTPLALLHQSFVLTIIYNVLFNYYACVTTKTGHRGKNYERVVRQLADATGFNYPETPQEVELWRIEFRRRITERGDAITKKRRDNLIRDHVRQHSSYGNIHGITEDMSSSADIFDKGIRQEDHGVEEKTTDDNGRIGDKYSLTRLEEGHVTNITSTPPLDCACKDIPCSSTSTTTQKRWATTNTTNTTISTTTEQKPTHVHTNATKTRTWTLLGPHDWAFCLNSSQPKPPRAHFDHVTKSLVLNMDHYCPWMFNVVGYFNYRYFCNFLLYVTIGLVYGSFLSYTPFNNMNGPLYQAQIKLSRKLFHSNMTNATLAEEGDHLLQPIKFTLSHVKHVYPLVPTPTERIPLTLTFMLCAALGIAVCCLLAFHIYLILTAQTTIEFHVNLTKARKARAQGQVYINPYNLGLRRNLEQIWGVCFERRNKGFTVLAFLWKILAPSLREPELLPVPMESGLWK